MESQPQNPEFRNNPENFRPCNSNLFQVDPFCFLKFLLHDGEPGADLVVIEAIPTNSLGNFVSNPECLLHKPSLSHIS